MTHRMNTGRGLGVGPARVPRRWRRRFVVGLYTGFAGIAVLGLSGALAGSAYRPLLAGAFALLATTCLLGQVLSIRPMAEHFSGGFDEREAAARDRAYRNAYLVLGTLALVVGTWTVLGGWAQWHPATQWQRNVLFWAVCLAVFGLPGSFMAWAEPDPLPPDPPRNARGEAAPGLNDGAPDPASHHPRGGGGPSAPPGGAGNPSAAASRISAAGPWAGAGGAATTRKVR